MTVFLNTGTGANGVGTSTTTLGVVFGILAAGQNGQALNFSLYNPYSPCTAQSLDLISGANTINTTTCPAMATASGIFICPPVGQGATITLKGVSGDTGIAIAFTGAPTFISLANPPATSFVLTTSSTITDLILVFV